MKLNQIGVSGCQLLLMENTVIRKVSSSEAYNTRLFSQLQKQQRFVTSVTNIATPKILSTGDTDGLFWFNMEYIDGKLFNEEFERLSKQELDIYLQSILSYLKETKESASSWYSDIELREVFCTKLQSLQHKSKYPQFIEFINNFIHTTTLDSIERCTCHGDLTFSNILFSKNKLYFIDFLDSYIESYVIDIVKLKQDLCYNWYLNLLPTDDCYVSRIQQIFRYMWSQIEQQYPIVNTDLFYILDVINFLRIEPYLTTPEQHMHLDRVIGETNLYEKFNSSNGRAVNKVSQS